MWITSYGAEAKTKKVASNMRLKKECGRKCVHTLVLTLLMMICLGVDFVMAQAGAAETIKGTVWYRERILVPANAIVTVSLVNLEEMDVAASVIASNQFVVENEPPWDFSVRYTPDKLTDKGQYGVQAKLENDGRLRFVSKEPVPVLLGEETEDVTILLTMVPGEASNKKPDASLVDTYWRAVELYGKLLLRGSKQKELHLILSRSGKLGKGFSGCNSFQGGFEQEKERLQFGPMVTTMMACEKNMEQEQLFLQALARTKHFVIEGETLLLFDDENTQLLRFEAVYLQ